MTPTADDTLNVRLESKFKAWKDIGKDHLALCSVVVGMLHCELTTLASKLWGQETTGEADCGSAAS